MLARYEPVDFSYVAPQHESIDARLVNWGRWSSNRTGSKSSPTFRLYRSTEQWGAPEAQQPIDALDAAKVQKSMCRLPTNHRLALSWAYIKRGNPAKAARTIGVSMADLAQLVCNGRSMLINMRA